jgi:tetratricopeptide (TPR) repeat protein
MALPIRGILPLLSLLAFATAMPACMNDAINTNKQELERQRAQLEQLQQQVSALQSQRASYSTALPAPGACDASVMREATRKGGERLAAGDLTHALGYYQDAASACPKNARTQVNLARAFEGVGDRPQALAHYRLALDAKGSDADVDAVRQAREAVARLSR